MADKFSPEKRSEIMSCVRQKNTKPELIVRSLLHRMGYRFRLHRKDLPGKPDIVLPRYKKIIFVHGCFWHGHTGCPRSTRPKTNSEYWERKIDKNINRDKQHVKTLREMGWSILIIWECETKDGNKLIDKLKKFMVL